MNGKNFNNPSVKLRALVAPLDWGLGHATRCIPIIKELIANGLEVFVGAAGATEAVLKKEFPDLSFLPLKGYNISYGTNKNQLFFKMLVQFPKIIRTIRYENKWLKDCIAAHHIDLVISDNRPGLFHSRIKTIYITHQLQIKTGSKFLSGSHKNYNITISINLTNAGSPMLQEISTWLATCRILLYYQRLQ